MPPYHSLVFDFLLPRGTCHYELPPNNFAVSGLYPTHILERAKLQPTKPNLALVGYKPFNCQGKLKM